MKFPKIYVHRNQHASQVVVANEEQEASLPSDYVPLDGTPSGATGAVPGVPADEDKKVLPDATGAANTIATGLSDLEERRADFDKATDDFAKRVRDQEEELTTARQQVDDDRALVEAVRKKLDEDRAYFEQEKAKASTQAPDTSTVKKDAEQAAASTVVAPAKRTRAARE